MGADLVQAQRRRGADELAEDAVAARRVTDPPHRGLVETAGEEPLEAGARVVEHAQRRVARPGQLTRDVEDAPEHLVEVELGHERPAHLQQPVQAGVVQGGAQLAAGVGGVRRQHRAAAYRVFARQENSGGRSPCQPVQPRNARRTPSRSSGASGGAWPPERSVPAIVVRICST